jgi:hypothetical protein
MLCLKHEISQLDFCSSVFNTYAITPTTAKISKINPRAIDLSEMENKIIAVDNFCLPKTTPNMESWGQVVK